MRPDVFLYVLAGVVVLAGIVLSYMVDIPVLGLGLVIIGMLLFLLPSMRRPVRKP